jgi:hypothetical protein
MPAFCLWCFLVELLLKLLETDEGHKRARPSRTEVILGQILKGVGGIARLNWRIGHVAAGSTDVVYRPVLRYTRKWDRTIGVEKLRAG